MRELRARRQQYTYVVKIIQSKWFIIFLCVVLFFIIRGTIRVYKNYTEVQTDLEKVKNEMQVLQKRNDELDTHLKHLESEEGKDYEIRQKLDVVKPGERVIKIIDASENRASTSTRE